MKLLADARTENTYVDQIIHLFSDTYKKLTGQDLQLPPEIPGDRRLGVDMMQGTPFPETLDCLLDLKTENGRLMVIRETAYPDILYLVQGTAQNNQNSDRAVLICDPEISGALHGAEKVITDAIEKYVLRPA